MLVLVVALVGVVAAVPHHRRFAGDGERCGYQSCTDYKPGVLNVHIVPHTHDDVGWLKTVDQYYYGNRNEIQKAGVQYILDSVVKELWEDSKRRFIYVETAFFHKWWMRQKASTQAKVHALVRGGRLKFVSGAWSMNDEAATHYQSTVDQFTWGLRFLNDTFGECGRPNMGWQIDPFGHAKEFASLLKGMGFDALFLGRIDYQDKEARVKSRTMEFEWQADAVPDANSAMFTHALYNTYSPPPGFCFDVLCNDEPIVDDQLSPDYNVDRRVTQFLELSVNMSRAYSTANVLVTMGEDFHYQDAGMWFMNLDRLIKHGNRIAEEKNLNITMYYSTPDCYYDAVRKSTLIKPLTVKTDDFFPYASDPHAFWTGYFTSRPTTKFLEAQTNRQLQLVKQLQVLTDLPESNMKVLNELKSTMGVLQHHDAITGTEKQHVTYDYVRMASAAAARAHHVTAHAFNKIMFGSSEGLHYDRCHFNESRCATSENATGNLIVTIFNPLAWTVAAVVRVPSRGEHYIVHDPEVTTGPLKVQIVELFDVIYQIPSRISTATHEAIFVTELKGLTFTTLYLERVKDDQRRDLRDFQKDEQYDIFNKYWEGIKKMRENDAAIHFYDVRNNENGNVKRNFKARNGNDVSFNESDDVKGNSGKVGKNLKQVTEKPYDGLDDEEMRMLGDDPMVVQVYSDDILADEGSTTNSVRLPINDKQDFELSCAFLYYPGYIGNNMVYENRSSGAYIFRPLADPTSLKIKSHEEINGDIVTINRYTFEGNASIELRKYAHSKVSVLEWQVGPISVADDVGKEYVIKYKSNLVTNGDFYTDSNGRQVLKRKLDERPTWNLTLNEHVAGNYYPIVDLAYVKNSDTSFSVSPDRPEGGASLEEGSIELMLHRRLLHDDAFGVGEALNETEDGEGIIVRGTHLINVVDGDPNFKDVIESRITPEIFISDAGDIKLDAWQKLRNHYSWLKSVPEGIHLLTIEPFKEGKILLRLENYLDASKESTKEVDLYDILKNIKIRDVKETLLAADRYITKDAEKGVNSFKIKLKAKEIRTFIIDYEFVES